MANTYVVNHQLTAGEDTDRVEFRTAGGLGTLNLEFHVSQLDEDAIDVTMRVISGKGTVITSQNRTTPGTDAVPIADVESYVLPLSIEVSCAAGAAHTYVRAPDTEVPIGPAGISQPPPWEEVAEFTLADIRGIVAAGRWLVAHGRQKDIHGYKGFDAPVLIAQIPAADDHSRVGNPLVVDGVPYFIAWGGTNAPTLYSWDQVVGSDLDLEGIPSATASQLHVHEVFGGKHLLGPVEPGPEAPKNVWEYQGSGVFASEFQSICSTAGSWWWGGAELDGKLYFHEANSDWLNWWDGSVASQIRDANGTTAENNMRGFDGAVHAFSRDAWRVWDGASRFIVYLNTGSGFFWDGDLANGSQSIEYLGRLLAADQSGDIYSLRDGVLSLEGDIGEAPVGLAAVGHHAYCVARSGKIYRRRLRLTEILPAL
jgi:hypothetical protein